MTQPHHDAAKIILDKLQHIMNDLDYIKEITFFAKSQEVGDSFSDVFDYIDEMTKMFFEEVCDQKVTIEEMIKEAEKIKPD